MRWKNKFEFFVAIVIVGLSAACVCSIGSKGKSDDPMPKSSSIDFFELTSQVSEGWNTGNTELALSAFTEDAVYMEPPDLIFFRGHTELRRFFNAVNPGSSMVWHRLWFDEGSGIGAGEYSFHNGGRETAAHGVAVLEIRDGKIAVWREYQRRGAIDFDEFLEVEGKNWEWTADDL